MFERDSIDPVDLFKRFYWIVTSALSAALFSMSFSVVSSILLWLNLSRAVLCQGKHSEVSTVTQLFQRLFQLMLGQAEET